MAGCGLRESPGRAWRRCCGINCFWGGGGDISRLLSMSISRTWGGPPSPAQDRPPGRRESLRYFPIRGSNSEWPGETDRAGEEVDYFSGFRGGGGGGGFAVDVSGGDVS